MFKSSIIIEKNHCTFLCEKKVFLLDTGSLISFSSIKCNFLNNELKINKNMVDRINNGFKIKIDGLIGMDILSRYNLLLDYKNKELEITNKKINYDGIVLKLESIQGLTVVAGKISNKKVKLIFDTGAAACSYLNPEITKNLKVSKTITEFHPYIGEFETNIKKVELELTSATDESKKISIMMYAGTLPDAMNYVYDWGVDGIIGYDLLENKKVIVDFQSDEIIV